MTDLHCGRIDDHEPHTWTLPREPFRERKAWTCAGGPDIEGGWAAIDAADDEWEEREIRERRESA